MNLHVSGIGKETSSSDVAPAQLADGVGQRRELSAPARRAGGGRWQVRGERQHAGAEEEGLRTMTA
jgi:hypothetical protein